MLQYIFYKQQFTPLIFHFRYSALPQMLCHGLHRFCPMRSVEPILTAMDRWMKTSPLDSHSITVSVASTTASTLTSLFSSFLGTLVFLITYFHIYFISISTIDLINILFKYFSPQYPISNSVFNRDYANCFWYIRVSVLYLDYMDYSFIPNSEHNKCTVAHWSYLSNVMLTSLTLQLF